MNRRGLLGAALAAMAAPAVALARWRNYDVTSYKRAEDGDEWAPAFRRAMDAAIGREAVVTVPPGVYKFGRWSIEAIGSGSEFKGTQVISTQDGPAFCWVRPGAVMKNVYFQEL